jgi:hypothetical protein
LIISAILYRHFWYATKVKIVPKVKTLTKVIPVTKTKIKYQTIKGPTQIQFIPQKEYEYITKTKLPKAFKNKKGIVILTTGKVPPYGGQTLVTSTLNMANGKGGLYFQQLPYLKPKHNKKFFSIKPKFKIGVGYGFMYNNASIVNSNQLSVLLSAKYRFIRVGNFTGAVVDHLYVNSNPVNFVGGEASVIFR